MNIFKCIELDTEFKHNTEMLLAIKENIESIITHKRTNKTKSMPLNGLFLRSSTASKTIKGLDSGFVYPVINTTNYMDSHNDVHIDGIWDKSVVEKAGTVHYTTDHEVKISNIIAYPQDVEMMIKETSFKELGYNADGNTQALMFKVNSDSFLNTYAKNIIERKLPIQHSVSMVYGEMLLCAKSDDKELKEENDNYNQYINKISNKEYAESKGFFWAQTEANIGNEGSMVALGSNSVTPMLYENKNENEENLIRQKEEKKVKILRGLIK
tara:strand:- start:847 stop:1653 length:807 start_codon:yes stop_codon:yes gene_type:complete